MSHRRKYGLVSSIGMYTHKQGGFPDSKVDDEIDIGLRDLRLERRNEKSPSGILIQMKI